MLFSNELSLVLTAYRSDRVKRVLAFCNLYFGFIPRNRRVIVVNNHELLNDARLLKKVKGWRIIEGSNEQHEFSAWQEGLDDLADHNPGSVIFMNDTLLDHRYLSFARILAFLLAAGRLNRERKAGIVGFTNMLKDNSEFKISGYAAKTWVSTYLFCINQTGLQLLGGSVWMKSEIELCVHGGTVEGRFFNSRLLSKNLIEWLSSWLFKIGGWYKSEPLSDRNADYFKKKALSIINEKLLSAKLISKGASIIDPLEKYHILNKIDKKLKAKYMHRNNLVKPTTVMPGERKGILFFVDFTQTNPYQKMLYTEVNKQQKCAIYGYKNRRVFNREILNEYKDRVAILHLHWINPLLNFEDKLVFHNYIEQLIYAKKIGYKLIWTVHNLVTHESDNMKRELEYYRLLSRFVDAFVVHSDIAKQMICKEYLADERRVFVVPHGVYTGYYSADISRRAARSRLGLRSTSFVLLYFGMIRKYKGVDRLIRVFDELSAKYSDVELMIVGKSLDNEVQSLLDRTGNKRIKFIDRYVDDAEIQVFMNAADMLVFPFEQILTSGSVMLALSFGKPVIAPRKGVLPDLINEKLGVLFDEGDSFSSAIEQAIVLWESGELKNKYTKSNFSSVIKKYQWKTIVKNDFTRVLDFAKESKSDDFKRQIKAFERLLKIERFIAYRIVVKLAIALNRKVQQLLKHFE